MELMPSLLTLAIQHKKDLETLAKKLLQYSNPLEQSIFFESTELTRIMLENRCSVYDYNAVTGCTALHRAVTLNYIDNVKMLLELGADVNAVDATGSIPLKFFIDHHDKNITKPNEKHKILKLLLEYGTFVTSDGNITPMLIKYLLENGTKEIIRVWLEFNVNLIERNDTGNNQLHYLASNTNPGVAHELYSKNFDVNMTNDLGLTPLDVALRKRVPRVEMVKLLLDNGADISASYSNSSCLTETFIWYMNCILPIIPHTVKGAYRIVFSNESKKCVELLLEHGADLQSTLINEKTKTILDCALANSKYHFAKFIVELIAKLEALGQPIHEAVQLQIESNAKLKKYFESSREQIIKIEETNPLEDDDDFEIIEAEEYK